jgi:phage terminase large subunit-like protein
LSVDLDRLNSKELSKLLHAIREKEATYNHLREFYPDDGPLRRELYVKHMEFFRAGEDYRERLMLAANRVGKTEGVGGYELTLHLTGEYPEWWEGRRFVKPISAWAAGDTSKTVRDIIQAKLLGPPGAFGTGLIPRGRLAAQPMTKPGVPEGVEIIRVRHKSGGNSTLTLKSYDQGRRSFQGTEQEVIWLDEEPPLGIYVECLMRTMTVQGMIMCTFTPLLGLSDVVLSFLPGGKIIEGLRGGGPKFVVMATWDDAPHLSEEDKKELEVSIPPHQRDSRMKGIPQLGSGVIYPMAEEEIICEPFSIPHFWPRVYGMDVGWNCTASLWATHNLEDDIVYFYSEYKSGQAEPSVHQAGIKSRGVSLPGVIDPASRGRSQKDGEQLLTIYKNLGLNLFLADNAVESGIFEVWSRLSTGRLKVFKNLVKFREEYRLYRRDENGKVVKINDHLMDCGRYIILSGLEVARMRKPGDTPPPRDLQINLGPQGWMV